MLQTVESLIWNVFFRCWIWKGKLTLKNGTLIASHILEILSQLEIKLNWLPMTTTFLIYMHGMCLTFGKPVLSGNYITPRYFLSISVKSVKVLIELSKDCYCNLHVPIPNKQTLVTRYVKSLHFILCQSGTSIEFRPLSFKLLLSSPEWFNQHRIKHTATYLNAIKAV